MGIGAEKAAEIINVLSNREASEILKRMNSTDIAAIILSKDGDGNWIISRQSRIEIVYKLEKSYSIKGAKVMGQILAKDTEEGIKMIEGGPKILTKLGSRKIAEIFAQDYITVDEAVNILLLIKKRRTVDFILIELNSLNPEKASKVREGLGIDWWDGMRLRKIIGYLGDLVEEGRYEEAAEKFSQLAEANLDLAVVVIERINNQAGAYIIGEMEDVVGLASVLAKVSSPKVAEILNAGMDWMSEARGNIISSEKAAHVLMEMESEKVAEVWNIMAKDLFGLGDTINIVKAMLEFEEGINKVATILSLMEREKAASILYPDDTVPIGFPGLSIEQVGESLYELYQINFTKAIKIGKEILNRMPAEMIVDMLMAYDANWIIPHDVVAQIIYYEMDTDRMVEVVNLMGEPNSLEEGRAVSIIKEMLQISAIGPISIEGIDRVVEIMSKIDEGSVAAIMSVEENIPEAPINGLSVEECVRILEQIEKEKVDVILVELDKLNPEKAQRIKESLWLRSQQDERTGLVRSLKTDDQLLKNRAYTYDQALAILHFLQDGDYQLAKKILDFYKNRAERIKGAFAECYNAKSGRVEEWVADAGVNSWLVMAILQYTEKTGDDSYMSLAEEIADWVIDLQKENGGIVGGYEPVDEYGNYKKVDWVSTEHNIDAYVILVKLYEKTGNEKYKTAADKVISWLKDKGFKNVPHRGEDDETVATDVVALAIIFLGPQELVSMGLNPEDLIKFIEDKCKVAVEYKKPDDTTINITGFDYTNAIETGVRDYSIISFEWTAEMICAYQILADYYAEQGDTEKADLYQEKADFFLEEFNKAKVEGIIPYASQEGWTFLPNEGGWVATNYLSVASTVWYSLSRQELNLFVF